MLSPSASATAGPASPLRTDARLEPAPVFIVVPASAAVGTSRTCVVPCGTVTA